MIRPVIFAYLSFFTLDSRATDFRPMAVDWPTFLARQDILWDRMPAQFDEGAFLGNGRLGATIYQNGDSGLRFEIGRSDVTEHRWMGKSPRPSQLCRWLRKIPTPGACACASASHLSPRKANEVPTIDEFRVLPPEQ